MIYTNKIYDAEVIGEIFCKGIKSGKYKVYFEYRNKWIGYVITFCKGKNIKKSFQLKDVLPTINNNCNLNKTVILQESKPCKWNILVQNKQLEKIPDYYFN